MGTSAFLDLQFDADCLGARRADGSRLLFTRQERALLQQFLRAPQRLLTRAQLLAAMDADDAISERNIDFLVNRLRTKLGDDARRPRYIRTQYGEGYVWVAASLQDAATNALIAIGPAGAHAPDSVPGRYLEGLRDILAGAVAPGREVVVLDGSPIHNAGRDVDFLVDAGLYVEDGLLRGILALRRGRTQRMLAVLRIATPEMDALDTLPDISTQLKSAIWQALSGDSPGADAGPSDEPIYVRRVVAERTLSSVPVEQFRESMSQLASRKTSVGDEPRGLLERANLLAAQRLFSLGAGGAMDPHRRESDEAEIESLVMAALPHIQDDPMLMLMAAKLLLGLGPAHRELAQTIVDVHFEQGAAFATALALRAQLRMYRGDIEAALELYDNCLAHATDGSEFRIYLLFLKAYALLAQGRRSEVADIGRTLHAIRPDIKSQFSVMTYAMSATDTGGETLRDTLASCDITRMRERVAHTWHMAAKRFDQQAHRVEFMRCIVTNAVRQHGEAGVPDDIWRHLGQLLAELPWNLKGIACAGDQNLCR